ncbi:putative bifunctional diguanylate cyclase/phosphodiesterase [Thermosynechococcus sp. M55_K2018_012]|uniref:putative bifunctional diguanylate cyclase/phosphodiesterase n=1 Tax=Thermosynechococcus sp. M55_K2018_012 TaxID=2747809 RepID=UPI001A0281A2|nr:EAL domain-containing protein [Thermosynechococcus sp. M55_K2018_012]HIK47552.1 EAL domain-containing protein [Thermosynechococcus sp. M55_K2018_012]
MPSTSSVSVFNLLIIENIPQSGGILYPYLAEIDDICYQVHTCLYSHLTPGVVAQAKPHLLVLIAQGDHVLKEVQTLQQRYPQLPLVVIDLGDRPDLATQILHSGAQDYLSFQELSPNLLVRSIRHAIDRHKVEQQLLRQAQYDRLLVQITQHIHQTLELSTILETAVKDVRELLGCDRVLIYRFLDDWRGMMEVEAVVPPWLSALGDVVGDSCFTEKYVEAYKRGRIHVVNNLDTADVGPCYRELLAHYQVKANLVVPIVVEARLWGLLICHQCAHPRDWQDSEIELIKQISTQLAIAILQAELYQKAQREIQERKAVEAQLLYQARHDRLTHLPNRWLFEEQLHLTLNHAAEHPDFHYAVLCLDLDRFKTLNDSLGHSIGDLFLQAFAKRLTRCVSPQDVVARLGGDEFAVLLNDIQGGEQAQAIAQRLRERLSQPFEIDHYTLYSTVSIGLVMGDAHYKSSEELLRDADMAMYHAKTKGRNRIAVFDPVMLQQVRDRLHLEVELRQAIERGDLTLHYQPIVNLRSESLRGFEALLRWQKGDTFISPEVFIPVAEETGLIFELSRWVLHNACEQLQQWQQKYPKLQSMGFTMSVNLSANQFSLPTLVSEIQQTLEDHHLRGPFLKIEITESVLMQHLDSAREILAELKAMGVRINIDDFGTGYSSLSYLGNLPLDGIKIDRSFISQMDRSQADLEVVHTILVLAHNLHLDCIAEGIENTTQLQLLRSLRCPSGQGYLFAPPLRTDKAEVYLQEHIL